MHPDEAELNGTMNALTASGLERLRHRFEEASHRGYSYKLSLPEQH